MQFRTQIFLLPAARKNLVLIAFDLPPFFQETAEKMGLGHKKICR
jgi:hypothetical protein